MPCGHVTPVGGALTSAILAPFAAYGNTTTPIRIRGASKDENTTKKRPLTSGFFSSSVVVPFCGAMGIYLETV